MNENWRTFAWSSKEVFVLKEGEAAEWIKNYINLYKITTIGRVISYHREYPIEKKSCKSQDGYLMTSLSKNGIKELKKVHRLVAEVFIGPCPKGMECCHNNGIRTDNRLENLRWDTRKNNMIDKINHGATARGIKSYTNKLTEQQVQEIRALSLHFPLLMNKQIMEWYEVEQTTIHHIINGTNWYWLPSLSPEEEMQLAFRTYLRFQKEQQTNA
jgi:hypothetical protein